MLYSLTGGLLCYLVTLMLRRIVADKQIWVCGILGAMAHNIGQILAAIAVTKTPGLIAYLPILLISAMVTGAFTGCCSQMLVKRLKDKV
jgi:heptaprenyl diphosphate synthase